MVKVPYHSALRALALGAAAWAATAAAASPTVFWLEPRSNVTFDRQVTQTLGKRAGLIVLRASWNNPDPDYTLPAVVARFKSDTRAPVLSYSWANRYSNAGRSEADLLRNLVVGRALADTKGEGDSRADFLDITKPDVRNRVTERFVAARQKLGVDGFAIDLSFRTPSPYPGELAQRCRAEASFCSQYASGMDALFGDLRKALGPDAFLAYNGLFNLVPGQLKDQASLLASTNAAAVEFFGMDPKAKQHSFSKDILPYLNIIATLPADRAVLVFGRGAWEYTDYAADYLWQRYVYASFLLAARPADLFKYHATFQVPSLRGRTGGMDYYEDWAVELGQARGPMKSSGGLYSREFSRGLVVVAPDDGQGGTFAFAGTFYTPEGIKRQGELRLPPGAGAILLREPPPEPRKPATLSIDARTIAGWQWKDAQPDKIDSREVVRLQAPQTPGNHDLLLDFARSPNPYEHLEIDAKLLDRAASIFAVAEVDDPRQQYNRVVVRLSNEPSDGKVTMADAVPFRSRVAKANGEVWPMISLNKDFSKGTVGIGAAAFEGTGYTFKRWSHLRLDGSVAIAGVALSNPTYQVREKP